MRNQPEWISLRSRPRQGYIEFCIHELFEQQAARTPDRIALICSGRQITFSEVNEHANRIARALQARGADLETFVGVCLERSIEAVTAVLGILKAGGVYVNLDPTYPSLRLQHIQRDTGLSLMIANPEVAARVLPPQSLIGVIDPDSEEVRRQKPDNPGVYVSRDNAAYVIYTSGSTGTPKGAVEVHGSMISRLISAPLPDIRPSDVCCLNSSFSFGVTATRAFFPLVQGARVVVLTESEVEDVSRFARCLDRYRITSVFMPPSLLKSVLFLLEQGVCGLKSLRAVTVTGSTLTPDLIERFRLRLPEATLINVYGSTEAGTTAAMRVHSGRGPSPGSSLGKPVVNTKIHILDSNLRPVRAGELGEICIASRHLAREYLNRPELTAQKFVSVPFGQPGERMYRTGDLGCLLPNGEVQCHGRTDHQVKIRGYRVELGEIEAAILGDESVQEAAVTAPGTGDERRLVAYIVGKNGGPPEIGRLKERLAKTLPPYMLPAAYITLRELPVTPAGKVDRKALPEPDSMAFSAERLDTPAETAIGLLFSQLLKVSRVSPEDNFIQLGGDSLGVTQLLVAIRSEFGRDLPARVIFDGTVKEIANAAVKSAAAAT